MELNLLEICFAGGDVHGAIFSRNSFRGGAKSIVMQIYIIMLIFYCFQTKFQGAKVSEGELLQGAPFPLGKKANRNKEARRQGKREGEREGR